MELSGNVQEILQITGNPAVIDDKLYSFLISSACSSLTALPKDRSQNVDSLVKAGEETQADVKGAHGSLVTLLLEAAKHDADETSLTSLLEDIHFDSKRIASLCKAYMAHKAAIRSTLSNIGSRPPHIIDVDWRLDYCLKENSLDKVNVPMYLIDLHTDKDDETGQSKVQFSCTIEQLQELVSKLKEASMALEKATQM